MDIKYRNVDLNPDIDYLEKKVWVSLDSWYINPYLVSLIHVLNVYKELKQKIVKEKKEN